MQVCNPAPPPIDLTLLSSLDVADWKGVIQNDFEKSVFPSYPLLGEIKAEMYALGADYASMTGSGSSVYGIFKQIPQIPTDWEGYAHWSGALIL